MLDKFKLNKCGNHLAHRQLLSPDHFNHLLGTLLDFLNTILEDVLVRDKSFKFGLGRRYICFKEVYSLFELLDIVGDYGQAAF